VPKPTIFEFKSTTADLAVGEFSFSYAIHFEDREALNFAEKIKLPEPSNFDVNVPPALLKNILRDLHLALGLSYYKLYLPGEFKHEYSLDLDQLKFWNTLYTKGLGEFLYRNQILPSKVAKFKETSEFNPTAIEYERKDQALSSIGGGKDSIVSTELLKTAGLSITTLYTQTQRINEATKKLLEAFNLPNLTIERTLDPLIFQKQEGSYNGHIPISSIFAFLGTLTAILCDYRYIVVANEHSSNFGNVEWEGMTINHQWSKSGEFEQLFQDYARNYITPDVTYFSLLRHSSELRIAKLFANYPKYFSLFSSCNQVGKIRGQELGIRNNELGEKNASVPASDSQLKAKSCKLQALHSPSPLWCGTCAKCCFVFLMLSASLKKKDLLAIFGRNLLEDESLVPMFKDLLGFGEMKPFDCVGTFEESRAALSIACKSLPIHPLLLSCKLQAVSCKLSLQTHPAPTLPARFAFLGMEKVAILGYGREGKVTKKYLKQKYPHLKIKVLDERKNKNYLLNQVNFDALVKTPGIQKDLVKIYYTTATNLFFAQVPHEQIIGVTGSKGKSTTASLIYAILKAGGKDVELLGNIGGPMLGALLTKNHRKNPFNNFAKLLNDKKLFVLELSSYQLDDIQASPHVAVVSNLFPEHMNYHGSLANYYKAKENITHFQTTSDFFIASNKIELAQKWHTQAKRIPTITKLPIIETDIPLLGEHNKDNVRAALTAVNLFAIPENAQAQAIRTFKGLPHRLEYVGEFKGIQFYDDAISTSPESTVEALNSLQNIGVLFLGGQDRGYNFTELEIAIKSKGIKNIVLFPESGEKMFTDTTGLNILHTRKMKDAVAFAFANAKPGEICLLSTASPSYSVWKNFIEKGNEFQKYAKKLSKNGH
jgi:UDP-N-acetylmuramoylalanine--D-glutamate ligase